MPIKFNEKDETLAQARRLSASGKHQEAANILKKMALIYPLEAQIHYSLGVAQHDAGNFEDAWVSYCKAAELDPEHVMAHSLGAVVLRRLGRLDEAVKSLERALAADPNHIESHNLLVMTLSDLGRIDEAREQGTRSLEVKDKLSQKLFDQKFNGRIKLNRDKLVRPREIKLDTRMRHVIAFSLWGSNPNYTHGAVINARIAPYIYGGWVCRFYCDETVPELIRNELRALGAEVILMPSNKQFNGLFWRFYVSDDPEVDIFLIRDCDSRLNCQEKVAVDEWLASDKAFHLLRDHPYHNELILAGMWGGTAGVLPPIKQIVEEHYSNLRNRFSDQLFLREFVWPLIKNDCLIHDSYFNFGNSVDFPIYGRQPRPVHVGGAIKNMPEWRPVLSAPFPSPSAHGTDSLVDTSQKGVNSGREKEGIGQKKNFIFTITTGRSGTVFLTELLKVNLSNAEVHHERLSWLAYGLDTPDASTFHYFNSVGNVLEVRKFWQLKFDRIIACSKPTYAEISHFLCKAGLVENLGMLAGFGSVHIVILRRDPIKIAWSLFNRHDFSNLGFTWLFYLDPRYPNFIVDSKPYLTAGEIGYCLWYVDEMFARAEYYKLLITELPGVTIHEVDLSQITKTEGAFALIAALGGLPGNRQPVIPSPKNETVNWDANEAKRTQIEKLADRIKSDPLAHARNYYDKGLRLSSPVNEFVRYYNAVLKK